jgi:kynurenine formamidase
MKTYIIDLSLPLYDRLRGVEIDPNTSLDKEGYNTTKLHLYSHAGTHMDAPRHFLKDGRTLERLELTKCIGPALVIDLTHRGRRELLTVADLAPYADRIGPGSRLLLRTGWSAHAEQSDYRTHFPRISLELAEWLVEQGVWLVGVEMPSVAALDNYEELAGVHQTLLRAEIVIVECLADMSSLPDEVFFIATPLKIQGGDGCPVRAVAVIGLK